MEGDPQDDQWELIAPLLPAHNTRGRPRADDRRTLNGILWVLRSGARWEDLPKEYGSRSTCHRRFQEWQDQGVWEQIWLTFLGVLDQQGSWIGAKLSWMAALYRLKRGGDIAYGWKEKGSTVHLVTEGNDLPLAFVVTAANVSEVMVGLKVVDLVRVPRPKGHPKKRPASLGTDKGYDSADFRQGLWRRGIQPPIPLRKWPDRRRRPGRPPETHEASQFRWKVERSHGWLDNWRQLVTRYDVHPKLYCLSDHRLFYDCPGKNFGLADF